jgi:hypothetical protein
MLGKSNEGPSFADVARTIVNGEPPKSYSQILVTEGIRRQRLELAI